MSQWVRFCGVAEAPAEGNVAEMEAGGVAVCMARIQGQLSAIDNWCPHRHGPMGQGWVEGNSVVCPWHSWTFDVTTGEAEWPVRDKIAVYPVRVENDDILIDISAAPKPVEPA